MKFLTKLGVAVTLAAVLSGCGNDGLVKLENKNPTIGEAEYNALLKNAQEKLKDYDLYHIDSVYKMKNADKFVNKNEFRFLEGIKERGWLSDGTTLAFLAIHKEKRDLGYVYINYCENTTRWEQDNKFQVEKLNSAYAVTRNDEYFKKCKF